MLAVYFCFKILFLYGIFIYVRDRLIIRSVIALLMTCIVNTNAYCFYVDSWIGIDYLDLTEDFIVTDTGSLDVPRIDVLTSVSIVNSGTINSDFYITDAHRVFITNSGKINGAFYVAPDAKLVQVIHENTDVTYLTVDRNFSVLVRDADDILLSDVFNIASNADKLILDNSSLVLNGVGFRRTTTTGTPAIEFVGDVVIKLNSADFINYSLPILRNVSDVGHVHFAVRDMNPLYNAVAYVDDGDLYMNIIRETDYGRIFENGIGRFLNDLRRDIPNDKLLSAMDSAPDIDTINSIMRDSVRLHPVNLMAPVRRMHIMDVLGGWRYSDVYGIDGVADVMFSDDMVIGRANISLTGNVANNLYAVACGYVGTLVVSDDINDFTGNMYGANLMLHFDDGIVVGNLSGGIVRADFDIGPVFDGSTTVNNPTGVSGYAAMDVGTYLYREYDLTIIPFAGVLTNYASVLNESDTTALANVGLELNLSEYDFDILYDYGIRGSILTDGAYHIGIYAKFSSPMDDIGARISTELIHDEFGNGYKIAFSLNMSF